MKSTPYAERKVNLLCDESVELEIVARLRKDGHDVDSIRESGPGSSDDEVLAQANQSQSVLITADKDFGELVFRLKHSHKGVLLIRLEGLLPQAKADLVSAMVKKFGTRIIDKFTVIAPAMVRVHH